MQTSAHPSKSPIDLGAPVKLKNSKEVGTVIGKAEYLNEAPSYMVRYVNGQGCLTTAWWPTEALEAQSADTAPAA